MRRLHPSVIALLGVLALVALLWLYTSTRNPDQDKLKDNQLTHAAGSDPEKTCAAPATYDRIKRELFRQAALARPLDQATFERLSSAASLRMEDPVMESQDKASGAINCSGSLSLDLPPGIAVAGGAKTLMGDVDYSIRPAPEGSGDVLTLHNADAIIASLATAAQTAPPQPAPTVPGAANTASPASPPTVPSVQPQAQPQPQPEPAPSLPPVPRPANTRASFDCTTARTRGEVAVCSDAGLAGLDRAMTAQYRRALSLSAPDQQALLRSTGRRFIAYRDGCPNTACVGAAYQDRMREISDIMQGRWQPPR